VVVAFATLFSANLGAQTGVSSEGCVRGTGQQVHHDAAWAWNGIVNAPRNAIRPKNLKWELPIAAASAVLIEAADSPASREIQSTSTARRWDTASTVGLDLELGTAALMYGVGCLSHRTTLRSTGLIALEAAGAASLLDTLVKAGTNRQRPDQANSAGEFWEKGKSFPSGHAAGTFAIATVIAHQYPQKRWLKWSMYALAAGVSMARFPAKKHFLSDILIGGTLGYVTGSYFTSPH